MFKSLELKSQRRSSLKMLVFTETTVFPASVLFLKGKETNKKPNPTQTRNKATKENINKTKQTKPKEKTKPKTKPKQLVPLSQN